MNNLNYTIKLLSDALPASGITSTVIIDTDIAVDELGIPFLPAKRIKGLLLESCIEVSEIMPNTTINTDLLFGKVSDSESNSIRISDAKVKDHSSFVNWLSWARSEFIGEFQADRITDTFSHIRRQTKIDDQMGTAVDHSLRTSRVLNKGLMFSGTISKPNGFSDSDKSQLALAFSNLRYFGVNRNRGFGKIACELHDEHNEKIDLHASYNEVKR